MDAGDERAAHPPPRSGDGRIPSLAVERLEQTYARLDERRYRYRSGGFTADLVVDDDGIVLQYGVNWKAVASGGKLD